MSLKSTTVLAIVLASIAFAQSKDCAKICTLEYNPICATNGKQYQLFGNPCMFEVANCEQDSVWTKARSLASCQADTTDIATEQNNCETPCTFELNPVCGFNGEKHQVFDNVCALKNAHCKDGRTWNQLRMTECMARQALEKNCEVACTREYKPTCGFNGERHEVFSNLCVMNNAHCKDGKTWMQTLMSECLVRTSVKHSCEIPCTMEYNPTCGFNGERHAVFDNLCSMNNAHCKDGKTWFQTIMTDCFELVSDTQNCEVPCTKDFNPVCGFNGDHHEVFDNLCMMKNAHCKDRKVWFQTSMTDCFELVSAKQSCEVPCTRELIPVCGFNGERHQVFSNTCVMKNEHCKDGKVWSETRFTECQEPEASVVDKKISCEVPCTREYNPVCGFNGEHHKIFSNKCVMDNEHCKDGQIYGETRMSDCLFRGPSDTTNKDDCSKICPMIYQPTCGFDGKIHEVFNNLCEMTVNNCNRHSKFQKVSFTDCQIAVDLPKPEPDCPKFCPLIYQPVCGIDGESHQVFGNLCEMEVSNCNQHTHFHQASLVECNFAIDQIKQESDCGKVCPMIYQPTCGFNGLSYKLFSSPCEMEVSNCEQHSNFQETRLSECQA